MYWHQILHTTRSYTQEISVSDSTIDLYFFQNESFTDLPLELGGIIKKRKGGLEKLIE